MVSISLFSFRGVPTPRTHNFSKEGATGGYSELNGFLLFLNFYVTILEDEAFITNDKTPLKKTVQLTIPCSSALF